MTIEFRTAAQRFCTQAEGRTTWHAFSFGSHYDPNNLDFGPLIALNDEELPIGTGYPPHEHSGVEIVTVVLAGQLQHTSDLGSTTIATGMAQRLSAGAGVVHSETNEHPAHTRFIQTWLRAGDAEATPRHAIFDPGADAQNAGWTEIAGPSHAVLSIDAPARLFLARPGQGVTLELPDSDQMLLFVCTGEVALGERVIEPSGQARLYDEPRRSLTVTAPDTVLLVWALS